MKSSRVKRKKKQNSCASRDRGQLAKIGTDFTLAPLRRLIYTGISFLRRANARKAADVKDGFVSSYRCSILIVDDEPAIRALLLDLLSTDFEVVAVASGEAARDVLAQRAIDVVLTD